MAAGLDLVVKATSLLLVAGVLAGLMRRASAASRHLVWTGMFVAALILPIARVVLPALPIAVWPAAVSSVPAPPTDSVALGDRAGGGPLVVPFDASSPSLIDRPEAATARGARLSPARGLIPLWLAGVALFVARIVFGTVRTRRWGRRAHRVIDRRLLTRLDETRRALGVRRPIALLVGTSPWIPVTWGVVRPRILVPSAVARAFDECPAQFDAVLVHEVAHIARWDAVSQVIARLAVAVWWFNPLFWLAARRARLERERACDDAVLRQGSRASDYASHLVEFVRTLAPAPMAASDTLSMARSSQLEQRVNSILDARTNRNGRSRASFLLTSALMIAMLPLSAVRLAARTPAVQASIVPEGSAIASERTEPTTTEAIGNRTLGAIPTRLDPNAATSGIGPAQVPSAPQLDQQSPPVGGADTEWRAARAEMFAALIVRARRHVQDATTMIEIGTRAPVDLTIPQRTLVDVENAAAADRAQPPAASAAEMAAVRQRFATAMKNLDAAEVRFAMGLLTAKELDSSMRAAMAATRVSSTTYGQVPTYVIGLDDVLLITVWGEKDLSGDVRVRPDGKIRLPIGEEIVAAGLTLDQLKLKVAEALKKFFTNDPAVFVQVREINRFVRVSPVSEGLPLGAFPVSGAQMSDADLIAALRNASTIASDTARADALLALAARNALSPEMVALYVSAANGIASDSERARVFAQPIRLKSVR